MFCADSASVTAAAHSGEMAHEVFPIAYFLLAKACFSLLNCFVSGPKVVVTFRGVLLSVPDRFFLMKSSLVRLQIGNRGMVEGGSLTHPICQFVPVSFLDRMKSSWGGENRWLFEWKNQQVKKKK